MATVLEVRTHVFIRVYCSTGTIRLQCGCKYQQCWGTLVFFKSFLERTVSVLGSFLVLVGMFLCWGELPIHINTYGSVVRVVRAMLWRWHKLHDYSVCFVFFRPRPEGSEASREGWGGGGGSDYIQQTRGPGPHQMLSCWSARRQSRCCPPYIIWSTGQCGLRHLGVARRSPLKVLKRSNSMKIQPAVPTKKLLFFCKPVTIGMKRAAEQW